MTTIREKLEDDEERVLSPFAQRSRASKGRARPEPPDPAPSPQPSPCQSPIEMPMARNERWIAEVELADSASGVVPSRCAVDTT